MEYAGKAFDAGYKNGWNVSAFGDSNGRLKEVLNKLDCMFTSQHEPGSDNVFTNAYLLIRDAKQALNKIV